MSQKYEFRSKAFWNSAYIVGIFRFALLLLLVIVPFRIFIAQPYIVEGESMSPTFENKQYLIVDQLTYHFKSPRRSEVIIFRFPNDPSKFFIKRVIGLPGETVELLDQDVVIKEGATGKSVTLDESYLQKQRVKYDFYTVTLGPDEYFVMGDNRTESSDSRTWGPVTSRLIIGRAFFRLFPLDRIDFFPGAIDSFE